METEAAFLTDIDRGEALRYLGFTGEKPPPPEIGEALDRWRELLLKNLRPRAVWRLFERLPDGTLAGTDFHPAGTDIARLLDPCPQVLLLAATLGAEAETLLRRTQVRRLDEALLLDALESAAIENVCDNLCADLAERFSPRRLTVRYSPGYGDFPLSQQKDLFRVLDVTRRIGVSLTAGGLMLPQKSVTALLGVAPADAPESPLLPGPGCAPGKRPCAECSMYGRCPYRKKQAEKL